MIQIKYSGIWTFCEWNSLNSIYYESCCSITTRSLRTCRIIVFQWQNTGAVMTKLSTRDSRCGRPQVLVCTWHWSCEVGSDSSPKSLLTGTRKNLLMPFCGGRLSSKGLEWKHFGQYHRDPKRSSLVFV